MSGLTRRSFLEAVLAAGGAAAVAPFDALARAGDRVSPGYGPLGPVRDETTGLPLLELPRGFRYVSFGWTGDALADGTPTPPAHDGMGSFAAGDGRVRIVRNHEIRAARGVFAPGAPTYDAAASGGTTTLEFDAGAGELVRAWASLTGTLTNCAGGPTPWGSWLTCEEDVRGAPGTPTHDPALAGIARPHGYAFEVPADGVAAAKPLVGLGRFVHEAAAVDPASGAVYLTEDRGESALYRFVPEHPGELARGGRLQALAVDGRPQLDTRTGQRAGVVRSATWVDVEDADPDHPAGEQSCFSQARRAGAALFSRGEGAWFGHGRIYFTSTNGGDAGQGQVWAYDPAAAELALIYESAHAATLNYPDNMCVSPRGGLVLCEDGGNTEWLHGLTPEGAIFRLCQNRVLLQGERNDLYGDFTTKEFAGSHFDPSGRWLFVNVQAPGITFAITGPWERGPL